MRFINRKWVQIFIIGLILLGVMERVLLITNNINLIPTVISLGSFLIPITFITYLYEALPNWEAAIPEMFICFLWDGAVGVVVAGFLEFNVLKTLGFLPMLAVGLIEESAKLILPLGFYFKGRLRSEATGILLGTSSAMGFAAMGFAAMETMGYAFVTLLQSRGNLLVLDTVLFARGVFSPAGHAAWTGLVCAILWKQRLKTNRTGLDWPVIVAFGTAVLLHALWDIFNSLRGTTFIGAMRLELLSLAIAVISLMLLNKRINEAKSHRDTLGINEP